MKKDDDVYYKAMLSKDYRFDGKFFVAVKTTKIYCRPVCPAVTPKRKNVEFFPDAISAEKAGYRPCLRCHPEFAPLSPAWSGTSAVVKRALKLIASNGMLDTDEEHFAEQFGMSARHLRRLFKDEIGLTPKQVSDNARLNFVWKLVAETDMSLTIAAVTAGFSSLRRFNDAFKKRYHCTPSKVRHKKLKSNKDIGIVLNLPYRPPLDWSTLIDYFQNHQIPFVETVKESSYERVFKIGASTGIFRIEIDPHKPQLKLHVISDDTKNLFEIINRVRKMFDLDSDPLLIEKQFSLCPILSQLWKQWPGLRLALGWDPFEIAIGAILGQCVSTQYASKLMGQLVANYGEKIIVPLTQEERFLFPQLKTLANASLDEVKTTTKRKMAIRELCQKLLSHEISFSEAQDPEKFKNSLLKIAGIGSWTAEYISLRAIGDTDAFPATDLILKRALKLEKNFDLNGIKPWRGYAAIYLWKKYAKSLSKKGGKTHEPIL